MSFSGEVKKELCEQISPARHCQIAEISAIIAFCGKILVDKDGSLILKLQTESTVLTKKMFKMLKELFGISAELATRSLSAKKNSYELLLSEKETRHILTACKLTVAGEEEKNARVLLAEAPVAAKTCCKRAFIRGAFLASGSLSNPQKGYHYEIVAGRQENGELLRDLMRFFSVDAKMIARKYHYVVYVKEGSQIVDLLNVMEAHQALMEFENVRILKEMRNTINRKVNCEAANINKTVRAASRQVEDILYLRDTIGLATLAEGLEEIALLRLEYPEATLVELGQMLHPPVGKSGVNHRLKKLSIIADETRLRLQ
ncbi:MAG: DNA-binding protein WhiA [Lachnospiraceae bacterium]|nr:DNA-binding protein WhiA [Lachnospiraceae bacterium]